MRLKARRTAGGRIKPERKRVTIDMAAIIYNEVGRIAERHDLTWTGALLRCIKLALVAEKIEAEGGALLARQGEVLERLRFL